MSKRIAKGQNSKCDVQNYDSPNSDCCLLLSALNYSAAASAGAAASTPGSAAASAASSFLGFGTNTGAPASGTIFGAFNVATASSRCFRWEPFGPYFLI